VQQQHYEIEVKLKVGYQQQCDEVLLQNDIYQQQWDFIQQQIDLIQL
jgi:hypothetical protein